MPGLYVRMLLPALLIYKNGSNLHAGTAGRYSPILIWSISYTLLTVVFRRVLTRVFKLPAWVTPALAFTNTTSLPLLLTQSLKQTQTLDVILLNGDTAADALERAGSYFLTNAMVSNSLTLALGPRLLRPSDEDAPNSDGNDDDEANNNIRDDENADIDRGPDGVINERTSLLPQRVIRKTNRVEKTGYLKTQNWYNKLSPRLQETLNII